MISYSSLKLTLFWLFLTLAISWRLRPFWGRGSQFAIWIPGNRYPLDWPASMIRWTMFAFGIVLIWWGWRLPFAKAAWDILIATAGSVVVLMSVYFPDLAYYCRQGWKRWNGRRACEGDV